MRREVHCSWIVSLIASGVVCGIIASQNILLAARTVWLIGAMILVIFCFMHRRMYIVIVAVIAGGVIGLWRGTELRQALLPYDAVIGR